MLDSAPASVRVPRVADARERSYEMKSTETTVKYYDRANRRLVYTRREADAGYWDEHWASMPPGETTGEHAGNQFYVEVTAKHLPGGSRVLEGGCGLGDKVWALQGAGFEAYGADFAADTVERALKAAPQLRLSVGDVRALPFPDSFFDGHWSIGVIEHFYDGFEPIASEMRRVLRPGGFLFLTFPAMSPLRRCKARLRAYERWDASSRDQASDFYQFALPADAVLEVMRRHGFELVEQTAHGGMRGLKAEMPRLHRLLRRSYHGKRRREGLKRALDGALAPLAGHSVLIVMKRSA